MDQPGRTRRTGRRRPWRTGQPGASRLRAQPPYGADRGSRRRGRITTAGEVSAYPLPTADAAPVGIHAGREAVWFTEIGAGQIGRISPDGRIEEFPLPDPSCRPHAIAVTADGGCWATLWATSSIVRLDRDGRLVDEISFQPGAEPHGLAIASDGTLWVALEAGSLAHLTG